MRTALIVLLLLMLPLPALASSHPNVVVVLLDDMGFSDLGFLGSEIKTPSIDKLANGGLTVSNFYVYPRCSPTRAALLTGRHPHEVGMGFLTTPARVDPEPGPYQGYLDHESTTLAEALKTEGYRTYLSGKWHLGEHQRHWPRKHGFDRYFGLISGASSYYELITDQPLVRRMALDDEPWDPPETDFYMTSAITNEAKAFLESHLSEASEQPFFLYLAYTAPHWPLHAPEEAVAPYRSLYTSGPERIREERLARLREKGLLNDHVHGFDTSSEPHDDASPEALMAVYAAQVTLADEGIGQVMDLLAMHDVADDTIVMVFSDNGASAVDVRTRNLHESGVQVGERGSYLSYGPDWAAVSNAPFYQHKGSTFEGGVRSPLVVYWPDGVRRHGLDRDSILAVTDIYPTVLSIAGVEAPDDIVGEDFSESLRAAPHKRDTPIFWEHMGWRGVREDEWKAVFSPQERTWRLFNLKSDPIEKTDLAQAAPERLNALAQKWQAWSDETGTDGFDAAAFMKYYQPRDAEKK